MLLKRKLQIHWTRLSWYLVWVNFRTHESKEFCRPHVEFAHLCYVQFHLWLPLKSHSGASSNDQVHLCLLRKAWHDSGRSTRGAKKNWKRQMVWEMNYCTQFDLMYTVSIEYLEILYIYILYSYTHHVLDLTTSVGIKKCSCENFVLYLA